ncbi:DNA-directed RNA polymerase, partial [Trifolium medium]|nr:DNA-directed RNA polymerase [Trifolium medium]
WTDPWVDGLPLSVRFERLYDFTANKTASVAMMFASGWGTGGQAWAWRM